MIKKLAILIPRRNRSPRDFFHSDHYLRHTARRLEHLASLGVPMAGCSVLELGAGIGDHTGYFIDRGCSVLATDAREGNLQVLRERHPHCLTLLLDMTQPALPTNLHFEVVHSYGLLYHLPDPVTAVARMADWCSDLLLLETCVSATTDGPNVVPEDRTNPTQAQDGHGCRPGRRWLFDSLKSHFKYVYSTRTQPRHPEFPLDWTSTDPTQLTRAVFVCSRRPLDLPSLTTELKDRHQPQP